MVRSKKAKLLGTPETKADGVLDAELGQSLGNLQHTNDTRSVVAGIWLANDTIRHSRKHLLDTRAGNHRVGVTSHNKDVVVVTLLGLGNDIVADTVLSDSINVKVDGDLASLELLEDGLALLLADADDGGVIAESSAERATQAAGDVVVHDDAGGTGLLGIGRLLGKGTLAS